MNCKKLMKRLVGLAIFAPLMVSILWALPLQNKSGNIIEAKFISCEDGKLTLLMNGVKVTVPKDQFTPLEKDWVNMADNALLSGDTARAVDIASQILVWDPLHIRAQQIVDQVNQSLESERQRDIQLKEQKDSQERYQAEKSKAQYEIRQFIQTEKVARQAENIKPVNILTKVRNFYKSITTYNFEMNIDMAIQGEGMNQPMSFPITMEGIRPDLMKVSMKMPFFEMEMYKNGDTVYTYMPQMKQYIKTTQKDLAGLIPKTNNMFNSNMFDSFSAYEGLVDMASTAKFMGEEEFLYSGSKVTCIMMEVAIPKVAEMENIVDTSPMKLWIEKESGAVMQMTMDVAPKQAPIKMQMKLALVSAKINENISKDIFTFKPPAGAKELNMSKILGDLGNKSNMVLGNGEKEKTQRLKASPRKRNNQ